MDDLSIKLKYLKMEVPYEKTITLEATVPTGLEQVAVHEITDKIYSASYPIYVAGRIYWNVPVDEFDKVLNLRSIDNISLFVDVFPNLDFTLDKEHDLDQIERILDEIDLIKAVEDWAYVLNYTGNLVPTKDEHDAARLKQDKVYHHLKAGTEFDSMSDEYCHNVLKYRVTCERTGLKHSFTSNEAAYKFGGEINNRMNWIVALSNFNLNILLRIVKDRAIVLLKLTQQSMHRRCLIAFGPTSLRPTIAYSMLYLAELKPGDHVLDPLCGGGSIPIECMHGYPETTITCGDMHFKAIERTLKNIKHQNEHLHRIDLFQWDTTNLPIRSHSIDVIVTDLPFGKRTGSKRNNVKFYRHLVDEFARVLRLSSGRLVILTQDAPNLFRALRIRERSSVWFIYKIVYVNVGALKCVMVVAWRKSRPIPLNLIVIPFITDD